MVFDEPLVHSSNDPMLAELLSMGFDLSAAVEALQTGGIASLADAVEFLLAGSSLAQSKSKAASHMDKFEGVTKQEAPSQSRAFSIGSSAEKEKSVSMGNETLELLRSQRDFKLGLHFSDLEELCPQEGLQTPSMSNHANLLLGSQSNTCKRQDIDLVKSRSIKETSDTKLDAKANLVLSKYFGYGCLKSFQLEALEAWAANKDCLVLAATGSGKSLCFQLPALLTGKVVVVISPLISLMHDQCLQLSKRGISACFLGSGQSDKSVENKALAGMYSIVYVCPETLPRLMSSFKQLVCSRGITLFAIDEAHCISKWGHDFRLEYRRLSLLRETFQAKVLVELERDIPIMALTATATDAVQVDILNSLKIDQKAAKIVRTTLFRPNLQFSVCHSKTTRPSSYKKDFHDLINYYETQGGKEVIQELPQSANMNWPSAREIQKKHVLVNVANSGVIGSLEASSSLDNSNEADDRFMDFDHHENEDGDDEQFGQELTAEFLEDDYEDETERMGGDFDVPTDEFTQGGIMDDFPHDNGPMGDNHNEDYKGPTIVYVPTRKETVVLAKFLCYHGVKAAAYHAKLPKQHLRTVHQQFHVGTLQVVVATIAFGMGIDKPNVRHIIHYGWPQSLEAYYQEAGRAGRDGLPSKCVLYCDMTVLPSLLPSRRDPEQTRHALFMLEQCFRYGLSTSKCRAKVLLKYFGEELTNDRCNVCDICRMGPPALENMTKEAELLLAALVGAKGPSKVPSINTFMSPQGERNRSRTFQHAIENISQTDDVRCRDRLWWRGFARVLTDIGFLKEDSNLVRKNLTVPSVKDPKVTEEGLQFLKRCEHLDPRTMTVTEKMQEREPPPLCIFPEGDMLQAMLKEPDHDGGGRRAWGRGWADPEIRRQRLSHSRRKPRQKRAPRTKSSLRKRQRHR